MADNDFSDMLDGLDDRVHALEPIALGKAAEHVRGVSVELAPILEGNLRASAGVTVNGDEAEVHYPGPYARYQHYMLDLVHRQGGQALYLEQPMITEAPKVNQIIADTLGEAF